MPSEARSPRLAVLIDADNAPTRIADGLFEEIAKIGEASVRRIYGDFSSARSKAWAEVLSKHAIIPQQQFAYTTGKNASDITLVIDAMDLLHSGRFDGFCLVSSDRILRDWQPVSASRVSTYSVSVNRRRPRASGRPAAGLSIPKTSCPPRRPMSPRPRRAQNRCSRLRPPCLSSAES